jgi:O-antigen ligase/tetratricopeptide (TPR) repeat protein
MKRAPKVSAPKVSADMPEPAARARAAVFWLTVALLVLVPLTFTTSVYRIYSMPKFALLLTLSAAITPLVAIVSLDRARRESLLQLKKSKHALVVCLYFIIVSISTLFGVAPVASLFGSLYNQMGLITHLCFFVVFLGLIVGIGADQKRFERALWAMGITGAAVATYACLQFFGLDPYLPQSFYTMSSTNGPVVRVIGTIGHSNSLGNFLLYTTPISAGLAIGAKGESRWLMVAATILSVAAVAASGTRGAWLGLVAGGITFAALWLKGRFGSLLKTPRRLILQTAIAFIVVLISILVISSNPASRGISLRVRSVATEGFTGAGRTILWRDSVRMVPARALTGSGPEGFRKAFLAYKSKELARSAPQINNESSHNSYLDAAISFGLPGMIAYIAIIASAFMLLIRSRRRAATENRRAVITGLLSALVAVAIHNFFIYDQISTGLYFFAVAALALVSTRVAGDKASTKESPVQASSPIEARWPKRAITAAGCLLFVAAAWYSISLIQADAAISGAFVSASRGEADRVVEDGLRATSGPDPTGDYDFLFMRALGQCVDRMQPSNKSQTELDKLKEKRAEIINLGIIHGERSLAHTLTPDASHLLLAYLALKADDSTRLRANATEALRWDPLFPSAHSLMAEAYLAEGDRDQAVREAELALDINPSARDARSMLRRLRMGFKKPSPEIEERIERGRGLASAGKTDKARIVLKHAIIRAKGPCPECHSALASVYESAKLYKEAIAEWQIFIKQTPDREAAEQARRQVDMLSQKVDVNR